MPARNKTWICRFTWLFLRSPKHKAYASRAAPDSTPFISNTCVRFQITSVHSRQLRRHSMFPTFLPWHVRAAPKTQYLRKKNRRENPIAYFRIIFSMFQSVEGRIYILFFCVICPTIFDVDELAANIRIIEFWLFFPAVLWVSGGFEFFFKRTLSPNSILALWHTSATTLAKSVLRDRFDWELFGRRRLHVSCMCSFETHLSPNRSQMQSLRV